MAKIEWEYWVTRDYGRQGVAVKYSKKSLGNFFYHLYKLKGEVTSTYVMNPEFDNCYVQFCIKLPKGLKDKFVEDSGLNLEIVPTFSPA